MATRRERRRVGKTAKERAQAGARTQRKTVGRPRATTVDTLTPNNGINTGRLVSAPDDDEFFARDGFTFRTPTQGLAQVGGQRRGGGRRAARRRLGQAPLADIGPAGQGSAATAVPSVTGMKLRRQLEFDAADLAAEEEFARQDAPRAVERAAARKLGAGNLAAIKRQRRRRSIGDEPILPETDEQRFARLQASGPLGLRSQRAAQPFIGFGPASADADIKAREQRELERRRIGEFIDAPNLKRARFDELPLAIDRSELVGQFARESRAAVEAARGGDLAGATRLRPAPLISQAGRLQGARSTAADLNLRRRIGEGTGEVSSFDQTRLGISDVSALRRAAGEREQTQEERRTNVLARRQGITPEDLVIRQKTQRGEELTPAQRRRQLSQFGPELQRSEAEQARVQFEGQQADKDRESVLMQSRMNALQSIVANPNASPAAQRRAATGLDRLIGGDIDPDPGAVTDLTGDQIATALETAGKEDEADRADKFEELVRLDLIRNEVDHKLAALEAQRLRAQHFDVERSGGIARATRGPRGAGAPGLDRQTAQFFGGGAGAF